jgi:TonB family protein
MTGFVLFIAAAAGSAIAGEDMSAWRQLPAAASYGSKMKEPPPIQINQIPMMQAVPVPPPPAPPPPPPENYVAPQPARPKGNPGNWVTGNDYPSRALRDELEGSTGFRVVIGVDGRVESCVVTSSSGSPALDEATCTNVRRRARFTPATDGTGQPVTGVYSSTVRWVVPREDPPVPGTTVLTYVLDVDGFPKDCRFTDVSGAVVPESEMCSAISRAYPYLDKAGSPVARTVTIRTVTTATPVKPPAKPRNRR